MESRDSLALRLKQSDSTKEVQQTSMQGQQSQDLTEEDKDTLEEEVKGEEEGWSLMRQIKGMFARPTEPKSNHVSSII